MYIHTLRYLSSVFCHSVILSKEDDIKRFSLWPTLSGGTTRAMYEWNTQIMTMESDRQTDKQTGKSQKPAFNHGSGDGRREFNKNAFVMIVISS